MTDYSYNENDYISICYPKEGKRQTMYVNGGTNYNIVKDDVIQIITENGKTTKKTMSSRDYLQLVIRTGKRNPIIP